MLTETVFSIHITHCTQRNKKLFAFTNTKQENEGNQLNSVLGEELEDEQLGQHGRQHGQHGRRSDPVGGGEGGQLPDGGHGGRLLQPDAGHGRQGGGGGGVGA